MKISTNRKYQKFVAHITNVFPLILVLLSLGFAQSLPLLGDQLSQKIGVEICSSLGTKSVYSIDDLEQHDDERHYCAFCSVVQKAVIPSPDLSFVQVDLLGALLYTTGYIDQNHVIQKFYSPLQPRAPPVYS